MTAAVVRAAHGRLVFDLQDNRDTMMPTAGLSLLAFMPQQDAIAHLLAHCVPANPSVEALIAEWQTAQARKGAPMPSGNPNIREMPAANRPYIDTLIQQPWIARFLAKIPNAEFKLVEIDPLITTHFMVDLDRAMSRCGALPQNPSAAELLPICLPSADANEKVNMVRLPEGHAASLSVGSFLLTASSLNLRVVDAGYFPADNKIGIQFGMPAPLAHVVRFNGRCYLHDGLHRAIGARKKGATHIPCIFRETQSATDIGVKSDRSTFELPVLEAADAPTVGHFAQGRAYDVRLKRYKRIVHVSWAEYGVADE